LNKDKLNKIIFLVSFWVFTALFFLFYDWAIIFFDPAIAAFNLIPDYDLRSLIISTLLATIVGGIFIASIEVLFFSKLLRKKPFGLSLLIKTAFYMTNIIFFTSMATIIGKAMKLEIPIFHEDIMQMYLAFLSSPRLWSIWIFWGLSVILALFILQISEKLGQGVLVNYLLGKYHRPREEVRIFMFLDLKSSTTHAEQLGHIRYSQLIQDCFYELTEVVTRQEAQIYQYVGDEIVLTWDIEHGLKNLNCLNAYYDYDNVLKEKKDYFLKKYGLVPEFKAGLDSGLITVAEVGEIKKELAYHGDVLNSASRIQGMCNQYHSQLLLSERLKNRLAGYMEKGFALIGNIKLKGKHEAMKVYKVSEKWPFPV
jgi:adenylate cyclase